jgi:hypothetical protein
MQSIIFLYHAKKEALAFEALFGNILVLFFGMWRFKISLHMLFYLVLKQQLNNVHGTCYRMEKFLGVPVPLIEQIT